MRKRVCVRVGLHAEPGSWRPDRVHAAAALALEPGGPKAHQRRAQALHACNLLLAAQAGLRLYRALFADETSDVAALEAQARAL